jgi:hypothetical protein
MSRPIAWLIVAACLLGAPIKANCDEPALREPSSNGVKALSVGSTPAAHVNYLHDIRPILSNTCYACHGPDEASREANLRLDRPESAFGSTASGSVPIVPGDPNDSELIRRISSRTPDEVMPPVDSGKSLSPEQIALLRRWIEQGADWNQHWAFVPPWRPVLPQTSDSKWPPNPIDYFVLEQLDQRGWQPSAEADKEILIRRVTFDLTGLPPTLDEVDAFLSDDSPGAYERIVDQLLKSPHYGEQMARFWLDAARYGDTRGLHLDNYREMWPYRDWVIKAFNDNLPYDQFTIEQLAGDLLPNPALHQRVATGFCRAHVSTNEGGSIEEEVFVRIVVDQVSTTGTVFLGLTVGCAVCHDHKYDPITQKEFYRLFAFFNSLDGPALDGNVKDPAPVVSVPSEHQTATLTNLENLINEIRAKRDAGRDETTPEYSNWLVQRAEKAVRGEPDTEIKLSDDLLVHCHFDDESGTDVTNAAHPEKNGRLIGSTRRVDGRIGA